MRIDARLLVPRAARQRVKGGLKMLRRFYARTARSFSPQDLADLLRSVGVLSGDVLLVHISYDRFEGFTGRPTDVIRVLQEAVGRDGTLLMPTMPFLGTAFDYVRTEPLLDVARTPSRMGLVTELFRRSPGVHRSVHPTHPVAAWGANVEDIIADHHRATTPCGLRSPYRALLDYGGKILLLGTGIHAMTFFHTLEEELDPTMPFSPFTKKTFLLECRDSDGRITVTPTRLFDVAWSKRRNLAKLLPALKQRGYWSEAIAGTLRAVLLPASAVRTTVMSLAARGVYCYDS